MSLVKTYLYLDTTVGITIGLWSDNDDGWLDFHSYDGEKGTKILHKSINDILVDNNHELKSISGIIYASGPGSYTGMRLSEGFVQILNWQGFDYYSFYHFDIPQLLGHKKGVWCSNAFKGEYFVYEWSEKKNQNFLIKKEKIKDYLEDKIVFSNNIELISPFCEPIISTRELIHKSPSTIFNNLIKNNVKKDIYYYRELNEEFKKSN